MNDNMKKLLQIIEVLLTEENFKFEVKENYIQTGIKFNTDLYSDIIIHPLLENNIIRFIALNFIDEGEEPRYEYFMALLKINFDTILGNFSWDLDEKTYLSIDFPLNDNTISNEQFKFCLYSIIMILEKYVPVLEKILSSNIPLREIFFSFEED